MNIEEWGKNEVNTARLMEMFAPWCGVEGKKKGATRRHDIHSSILQ